MDLYFVNQGLHSARDNAEFLLAIYGAMDSEYIRELGRKTHRGLEGQARKGWSAGGIAYGYRREPVYDATQTDRDGQARRVGVRWIPDCDEVEIVRRIFRWYADGLGMGAIATRLNAQTVPSPRQAKGHRLVPGTRRRRRQLRPESEWVVVDRPDLRIIDQSLWHHVQTRRAVIRAHYTDPSQFGKSRAEYGAHLLSGRLVCGECGGSLTIRTGKPSRYGCTRHWRRGSAACSNNILVRRDLAEQKIAELLQAKLYTQDGVRRLVEAVNARLRAARPATAARREQLMQRLSEVRRRLEGLRGFVEQGDTSAKVRTWLADAEADEQRLEQELERLGAHERQPPIQIHPGRVERYLRDLRETLLKAGARARRLLQTDLERIVIHPVRLETAKPFARAEIVTTGKGLLARVAFVVAGAGFEPATFGL